MIKILTPVILVLFCLLIGNVKSKNRCYVCKLGCDDPAGYLQYCPEFNATAWQNETETPIQACYKYHLREDKVKIYKETPEKTDLTEYDMNHFLFPKEYRNCAYTAGNNKSRYFDADRNEVCDTDSTENKYNCFFCDKIGCNGPTLGQNNTATNSKLEQKIGVVKFISFVTVLGVAYIL